MSETTDPSSSSPASRVKQLFADALDVAPDARAAFVAERSAGDESIRDKVLELLAAHERAGGFLGGAAVETEPSAPSHAPAFGELPARMIGPYKLLQPIGEGGFGTVYLAEQDQPVRRRVALKIIKLGMDTRQVIARFEAERQALAMMDHPNIARVLDAGATEQGRPFFVMELVNGVPVTEYCDANRLSTAQRLALFVPICQAVQHAHQKGIIHRDLKPSNVLVTLHDDLPVPKVIDFGVAKATQARLTEKTLFTEFRQMIGTLEYMSPEQAEISGLDVDTRSDVYSLGVLLYELLTGATPFDARELRSKAYGEIQRVIREVDPPKPSTKLSTMAALPSIAAQRNIEPKKLGALIRGELDWIVMKCLEKNRARRYESASALAADVTRYLGDEPVSAGPPSAIYRSRKFARRHKVGIATAALVVLALTAGLAVATWGLIRATRERDSAVAAKAAEAEAREYERQTDKFLLDMFSSIDPAAARGRVVSVQEILDRATAQIDANPPTHPIVEASLRYTFAQAYKGLGLFEKARPQLERAEKLYSQSKGANSISAARARMLLGTVLNELGQDEQAEPLLRSSQALLASQLGEDDRDTLRAAGALDDVLVSQNKLEEADALGARLVERSIKALGADDEDTNAARLRLASLRGEAGRYNEAIPLLTAVRDWSARKLGADHPDTLGAMSNLANLYRAAGRESEAEPLFREALASARKVLGVEHPSTLVIEQNLALVLQPLGKLDESAKLYADVIARRSRVLGPDAHPTLLARSNYGLLLQLQGKLREAQAEFEDVAARMNLALGADAPDTIVAENNIAWLKVQRGELEEAETIYRALIPRLEKAMGKSHPYYVSAAARLGHVLDLRGKYADAEPILAESYSGATRLGLAGKMPFFAAEYGECLAQLGKVEQARPILEQADRLFATAPTPPPAQYTKVLDAMRLAFEQVGDAARAEEYRKKIATLSTTRPTTVP